MELAARLAAEAGSFVSGLDAEARALALLPFDDDLDGERRHWVYWPDQRRGVPLWALNRAGTKAAHRLLAAMVGEGAFARAVAIMALDEELDRRERFASDRRHRDDYWVTVFGEPGSATPWGVRFEGHHVSVHATVVDGEVALTPLFLGANPAVVDDGGHVVSAPLAPEERLGFELLHALPVEQRASAVVADEAPDDIATRNAPSVEAMAGEGVPLATLGGAAAAAADALVDLYLRRLPAGARVPDPGDARFAWAGAAEPGTGHYYRLAGPRLLVELDNTQNGANHVHTVVRDPAGDFGGDVLAAHHRRGHRHP